MVPQVATLRSSRQADRVRRNESTEWISLSYCYTIRSMPIRLGSPRENESTVCQCKHAKEESWES